MAKGQLRSNREKKKKPKADSAGCLAVYAGVAYWTEDRRQEILVIVLLGSTVRDAFPAHCSSRSQRHNQLFRRYSEPGVPSKTVEVGDLSGGRNSPIECSSVLYESMTAARRAEMRPSKQLLTDFPA